MDFDAPSDWTPDDIAAIEADLASHDAPPSPDTIQEQLDHLATLRADFEAATIEKQQSLSAAIPQEIRDRLNAIEEEYDQQFRALSDEMAATEAAITRAVLAGKATAKGRSGMMAIYNDGRVTWDTKGLQGYAKAHGEVLSFMRVGKPFVTVKKA